MARFYPTAPTDPVPRPVDGVPGEADGLPVEAQVPDLGFTPPGDVPDDLPIIPVEQFAGNFPDEADNGLDGQDELPDFFDLL
jgi:hypothetical protein